MPRKAKPKPPRRGAGGKYLPGESGNPAGSAPWNPVEHRARLLAEARAKREAKTALAGAIEQEVGILIGGSSKRAWSQSRCRICSSPHRAEVGAWRAQGLSYRRISSELAALGLQLSDMAVRRHLVGHVDVAAIMAAEIAAQQADIAPKLDARRSDIDRLGGLIERASQLEMALAKWMRESAIAGHSIPMSIAHAYESASNAVRQCVKLKSDLSAGQPSDALDSLLQQLFADSAEDSEPAAEPGSQAADALVGDDQATASG